MKKGFQRLSPGVYRNATGQVRTPQQRRPMGQQQMPMQPTPRPMAPQMGMQGNPMPRPMAPQWQQPMQPMPRPMPMQHNGGSPQMPPGVMPGFQLQGGNQWNPPNGLQGMTPEQRQSLAQQVNEWRGNPGQAKGLMPQMSREQFQQKFPQMAQQMQNRATPIAPVGLLSQPPKV